MPSPWRRQTKLNSEAWVGESTIPTERPPLLGEVSSWLQIQRPWFDSRRYHIFWEVVGLERGQLSLVSTIEELLERKRSGSGLEHRDNGRRDPSRWPLDTIYPQILALTSLTSGFRSVGIVCLRTQATEFVVCVLRRLRSWYTNIGWSFASSNRLETYILCALMYMCVCLCVCARARVSTDPNLCFFFGYVTSYRLPIERYVLWCNKWWKWLAGICERCNRSLDV
jgi:hypothetical protein